jgi:chromosome segregation ATPase
MRRMREELEQTKASLKRASQEMQHLEDKVQDLQASDAQQKLAEAMDRAGSLEDQLKAKEEVLMSEASEVKRLIGERLHMVRREELSDAKEHLEAERKRSASLSEDNGSLTAQLHAMTREGGGTTPRPQYDEEAAYMFDSCVTPGDTFR